MREILFRGKRVRNGEWVYGSLIAMDSEIDSSQAFIFTPPRGASSFSCGTLVKLGMVAVDTETIGQYTGLTDKNGKKIFEGDIVKRYWGAYGFINFRIDFVSGEFLAVPIGKKVNTWVIRISGESENLEVIGNIRDNPELLRGADNG